MTSQLDVRYGAQTPTVTHSPPGVVSSAAAADLIELADAYGVCDGYPLSESQKITLRLACGERADGSWAATRVADFGPRQGTGKNDKIAARELAGLLLFGEQLQIHTAHEFPTANESFLRLVSVFENWDDLRSKVARIRYANGEQGIELRSGQRLKYRARTGGSGRGFAKADLVVYDEAQHLSREHVAASGPAKLANPNSQTWYAGSGGMSSSLVAWSIRRAALAGTGGRLAYTEMTAEDVSITPAGKVLSVTPGDLLDRDVWYACIPGLGRWVSEEGVEALYDELGPAAFAREILCVWEPAADDEHEAVIPNWADLADPDSRIGANHCLALDVSPNREHAAFGAAGRRDDGGLHVEAVECRPRTDWVFEVAAKSWNLRHLPIRIQTGSPAASFIDPFREAGIGVVEVSPAEHGQAVGQLLDACAAGTLHHPSTAAAPQGSTYLASAVRAAELRSSGDVNLWARRSPKGNITPLVAVTLALGGVPTGAPSIYEVHGMEVFG